MRTTSLSFLLVVCLLPATLRAQAPAPREAEAALVACLAASAPGSVLAAISVTVHEFNQD